MSEVKPYSDSDESKRVQIEQMFDNIAPRYDLLNRSLSLGIDIIWRKNAINLLKELQPKRILDVATGTADFAIQTMSLNPDQVVGIDISGEMLRIGDEKIIKKGLQDKIVLKKEDSENLSFQNNSFDAVIVAFGVRNFQNLAKGVGEIFRVTKPGGKAVVLELSRPRKFPVKQVYNFYFKNILPRLGAAVSKDSSAYTYLPESVAAFPEGEDFLKVMGNVGFKKLEMRPQTFGICTIYSGTK